jgi:hypothetical protein
MTVQTALAICEKQEIVEVPANALIRGRFGRERTGPESTRFFANRHRAIHDATVCENEPLFRFRTPALSIT